MGRGEGGGKGGKVERKAWRGEGGGDRQCKETELMTHLSIRQFVAEAEKEEKDGH